MGKTLSKIKWWRWLAAIAAIEAVILIWVGWDGIWQWSHDDKDSNAETLRNLALVAGAGLAALIGFPLAIWRSFVAYAQAKTSERNLNNERYQKGAEMLGNEAPATRIGGVYALETLAQEHPGDYHIRIANLLCTFIRHPTKHDQPTPGIMDGESEAGHDGAPSPHETIRKECAPAVELVAQVLGKRRKEQREIEGQSEGFRLDLRGAQLADADLPKIDLSGAELRGANLSRAVLNSANLSGADLCDADLSGAEPDGANLSNASMTNTNLSGAKLGEANFSDALLWGADLSGASLCAADLPRANLTDANLTDANLSDAMLDEVKGLTQGQLDMAYIWEGYEPPDLTGAVDLNTGEPLEWRGETQPDPNDLA